jgi:arginyl-tRNA synthetase
MGFELFRKDVEKLVGKDHSRLLEIPKDDQADLALPCFVFSKELRKAPQEIAKELERKISSKKLPPLVREVKAVGPYLNFFMNSEKFGELVLKEVRKSGNKYGSGKKKKTKIVVEFPGPNTNKPLHLGHMRNMILGTSMSNIFHFLGNKVTNVDIVNDRGVHICKSMLAYKYFGNEKEPNKKPDHFVGDFYVLFAKQLEGHEGTEEELRKMLLDWENGEKDVRALWKKMNKWALDGFKETYKRLGVKIDKTYFESDHYRDGKAVVLAGVKKKVFKEEDGNVVIDLEDAGLGKRVLLRRDGTSVYITQDIALAIKRYKELKMNRMIYVVGEEQKDHFRALFKILEILGYPFAKNCFHLWYGLVNLPEGKMKSREGTVVDADDLMDEMHSLAKEKIKEQGKDVDRRAEKIGLAAIKYFIAKYDPQRPIMYDPKASLDFEGDTGPYILYTYARANSILEKSAKKPSLKPRLDGRLEFGIAKKMSHFPSVVEKAADEHKPNLVANYVFELATLFNEFYHATRVIGSEKEADKLALVRSVMTVIENGLALLGIDVVEEM